VTKLTRRKLLQLTLQASPALALGSLYTKPAGAVRYGEIVPPEDYRAVGQVSVLSEYPGRGIGTGTLVAPDIVVTAGHVIDGAASPHHIKFNLDGRSETASVVALAIPSMYLRSLTRNTPTPEADIALLKLDRKLEGGIDYYPLLTDRQLDAGQIGHAVGFGLDATGKLNIRTHGTIKYFKSRPNGCALMVPGDEKNQITDSGDSGGPFLIPHGRSYGIAGITQAKFFFEPDEDYPEYDAIDLAQYAVVTRHADWLTDSVRAFQRYQLPDSRPRYVRVGDLEQLKMPLTFRQVGTLLKVRTSPQRVLSLIRQRGMTEPYTDATQQSLRAAGANQDFIDALESMAKPVMTSTQLLALVRSKAPEDSVYRTIWNHGGLYGDLNEQTAKQLRDAGADSLIDRFRNRYQ